MNLHVINVLSILLVICECSTLTTTKDSQSYVGAVVEYHPITGGSDAKSIADTNANNFLKIIKTAESYAVDIIVFSEYGLTNIPHLQSSGLPFNTTQFRKFYQGVASPIPSPKDNVTLCKSKDPKYSDILKKISCAADEFDMYVVVNHYERIDCPTRNCSSDGFLLYNTNVVFDRKGTLIARYRKYNLLHEPGTNVTSSPEISTFTTDFGVTFGQLICFDLLNEKPADYFVKNPNVTDIVYSSRLFSESPFLDSTQAHAAWAYAADVNFLAASYNGDTKGTGGSGIYAGKSGPIKIYHPGMPSNALIVAEIPKLNRRNRINHVHQGRSFIHVFEQADVPTIPSTESQGPLKASNHSLEDLRAYTSIPLDTKGPAHITTLCDRGLCCDFHVQSEFDESLASKSDAVYYKYKLVVFNGVRDFPGGSSLGIEVCAVVACTGDDIDTCGRRHPDNAKLVKPIFFDSLIITRRANSSTRSFYTPTNNDGNGPFDSEDFGFIVAGPPNDSLILTFLDKPTNNLSTFGIYGRRYDRDGEPVTKPSSATKILPSAILLLILAVFLQRWFN